jgi:oligopeptide/dipeptide ABC transporter ATP-binding protein
MNKIVETTGLIKEFPLSRSLFDIVTGKHKSIRVLDGVDLFIFQGETLGLVGESGSGKTTLGRTLLGLVTPTFGKVTFEGKDLSKLRNSGRLEVQAVFQDPDSSLDPMMSVKDIIAEPLLNSNSSKDEIKAKVIEAATRVKLSEELLKRYPFELSGGQKQRVGIARALISRPRFVVLDEPTSALDVSIQAQLLNLLIKLQEELGLTYLFISHNVSVVNYISDRVAVMYAGQIVETSSVESIVSNPFHPYTKMLLASVPYPDPSNRIQIKDFGEVPSLLNPPRGCRFNPRCPHVMDVCKENKPAIKEGEKDHYVACYLHY